MGLRKKKTTPAPEPAVAGSLIEGIEQAAEAVFEAPIWELNTGWAPTVGGIVGGIGCSTVALISHGRDMGVLAPGQATDVVVAPDTAYGLMRLEELLGQWPVEVGPTAPDDSSATTPRPVLVLIGDAPRRRPPEAALRLRMAREHIDPTVIAIPWIERLRHCGDAPAFLGEVFAAERRAKWARQLAGYGVAVRHTVAATPGRESIAEYQRAQTGQPQPVS